MACMTSSSIPSPLRWVPSFLLMVIIFFISSLPAHRLPFFGAWDLYIKKGGHALGFGLLGLAYYYALPQRLSVGYQWVLAFMMAILFALSDEFHQSFVEGRTSSLIDVVIDGVGAAVALTLGAFYSLNSNSKSIS